MNQTTTIIIAVLLGALLAPGAINQLAEMSRRGDLETLVSEHVRSGQRALEAGDLELAEVAFQEAMSIDAAHQAARRGLSETQARRVTNGGESLSRGSAIALKYRLEDALNRDKGNGELYRLALGNIAIALAQPDEAARWFGEATKGEGVSSKAWASRGGFEFTQGRLDDAAASLKTALTLDEKNADARLNYGMVLKEQKKIDEAITELKQSAASLKTPKAHYELGDAHLRKSDFEPAYASFVEAAKVHPDLNSEPSLLKRLGITAYRLKKFNEAVGYLSEATKRDPDPELRVNLGIAFLGAGDNAAAAQQLARVIEADPAHAEARAYLMKALVQLNQISAARKLGRQYMTLARNRPAMKPGIPLIQGLLTQLDQTRPKPGPKTASGKSKD